MRHTVIGSILMVLVVMVFAPSQLMAGGWTAVTLDELPLNVKAGEPFTLGFMVRQHGVTPVDLNLNEAPVLITFRNSSNGEEIKFEAEKQGAVGHYVAQVTLPTAARWALEIKPSLFPDVVVADLEVQPPINALQQFLKSDLLNRNVALGMILLALLGGLTLVRTGSVASRRWAIGALGVLLVAVGLLFGWIFSASAFSSINSDVDDAVHGKALFEAKGCIACHVHDKVTKGSSIGPGPNLTHYTVKPEFLRQWLANPQTLKPEATMPNLYLTATEIDALVSFLETNNEASGK